MNSPMVTDKKIFVGVVVLIALTIALIVGITVIQQPQTTTSDAGTEPTPYSLPGEAPLTTSDDDASQTTDTKHGDTRTSDTADQTAPGTKTDSTTDTSTDQTAPASDVTQETTDDTDTTQELTRETTSDTDTTTQITDSSSTTTSTNTPTPTTTSSSSISQTSPDSTTPTPTTSQTLPGNNTPTPTRTILADSGTGDTDQTALEDDGLLSQDDAASGSTITGSVTSAIGGSGDSVSPTSGTSASTQSDELPTAGIAHLTILILAASLLLVVLGLAL